MSSKLYKIFILIILLAVVIFSFYTMIYIQEYSSVKDADLNYPYYRSLFKPEHGRFIATALSGFFCEKLPFYLNIHPNDLLPLYTYIKGFCIVTIVYCLSGSLFVFNNSYEKCKELRFPFITTYIVLFLYLFNKSLCFLEIDQTLRFFEYVLPFIFYFIFMNIIVNHFVYFTEFSKKDFLITLIFSFLLGISIECLNIPILIFLFFINLYVFISKSEKLLKKQYLSIFLLNFFSNIIYYAQGSDTPWGKNNDFKEFFIDYCNTYLNNFILRLLPLYIIILVFLIIIFFIKKNKEENKRIALFTVFNTIAFTGFYFIAFIAEFFNTNRYFLIANKFFLVIALAITYTTLISIGYLVDKNYNKVCASIVKVMFCIIAFLYGREHILINYIENIEKYRENEKILKEIVYKTEKDIISQKGEELVLSPEFTNIVLDGDFMLYVNNFRVIHSPYMDSFKKIIIDKNYKLPDLEENEKIVFSNLLKDKTINKPVRNYIQEKNLEVISN